MATDTVTHYSAAAPRPFKSFLDPLKMARSLWSHRDLILQLAKRDIAARYRAATLGLLWSLLTPLVMLLIYTFVFSVVFGAKWNIKSDGGHGEFAIYLFCGMLMYTLFSELVNRAPSLVVANTNYVKKVVFPLEVLVVSALLMALFNLVVGYVVWVGFWVVIRFALPPVTILLLPLIVLPLVFVSMGVAWIVASLGVFVRDVSHTVSLSVQALFFLTPVFYRIDNPNIPSQFQLVMRINPLSTLVEWARDVTIEGQMINWLGWGVMVVGTALVAVVGYAFFMKSKRAFADVL